VDWETAWQAAGEDAQEVHNAEQELANAEEKLRVARSPEEHTYTEHSVNTLQVTRMSKDYDEELCPYGASVINIDQRPLPPGFSVDTSEPPGVFNSDGAYRAVERENDFLADLEITMAVNYTFYECARQELERSKAKNPMNWKSYSEEYFTCRKVQRERTAASYLIAKRNVDILRSASSTALVHQT
jgi:hypothetical protein